jgi:hypothetical protein
MEAGNKAIGSLNASPAALAYNILHSALTRSLTVDVVAAFDWSDKRPLRTQTKASIPSLAHHLRVPGVHDHLLRASRDWGGVGADQNEEDCRLALDRIEQRFTAFIANADFQDCLKRLREVRHYRLAHNLFDREPAEPTYSDLSLLLDLAREFASDGLLAVAGKSQDYSGAEREAARSAEHLWMSGLG